MFMSLFFSLNIWGQKVTKMKQNCIQVLSNAPGLSLALLRLVELLRSVLSLLELLLERLVELLLEVVHVDHLRMGLSLPHLTDAATIRGPRSGAGCARPAGNFLRRLPRAVEPRRR